jgi:outer membrane lipase/esterase
MVDAVAMSVVIGGVVGQGRPMQGALTFSQFIGFGDSSSDSGYFFTHNISTNSTLEAQYQAAVAAGGGIPTSLGGAMYSALLAQDYGLAAIPIGEPGGTNYAASGATVTGTLSASSLAPSIVSQIQTYLASTGNHADPNAIYLVTGGGNDVTVAETKIGVGAQDAYIIQQAHALAQAIEQLHAAGAQYFVSNGAGNSTLGLIFTDTLWSDLAAAGISFISPQNNKDVIQPILANPAAFGITNTTQPPAGPFTASNPYNPANGGADINPLPSLRSNGWAVIASQLVSANAGQTYLWADDQHLSAAGQQFQANDVYNLIENAAPTVAESLTAGVRVVGNGTTNFAYQWESLAHGQTTWNNISGATGSTYVVQQADLGSELRVQVTYTDGTAQTLTEFSQPTAAVASLITPVTIQNDYLAITRTALSLDQATTVVNAINAGTQTETQYANSLLSQVANTTIPAVAVEGSMYGVTGSSAEITKLVTGFLPAQVANAILNGYNPQVYACEALGLVFAFGDEHGGMAFATNFGPSNAAMPATTTGDAAFAAAAASAIFGSAATANTPGAIHTFVSNWEAFYTSNGIPGIPNATANQIDLAARGAAWGDAVGVALANNLGALPGQVANFLHDAAHSAAIYSASLSIQPNAAPFQGAATASVASAANDVQLTGVAAPIDHIVM